MRAPFRPAPAENLMPTMAVAAVFVRGMRMLSCRSVPAQLPRVLLLAACVVTSAAAPVDPGEFYRRGEYSRAIEAAQEQREENTTDEMAWRWEAEALLATGQYRAAESLLREAVRTFPGSLRLKLLARVAVLHSGRDGANAIEVRDVMRAIQYTSLARGHDYARSPEFQAAVGEASLLAGLEPRLALENFLRPAQAGRPPSRDAFLATGRLALEKRDHALAARTFRDGLAIFPDDPDLLTGLAASFGTGARSELVTYAQRALAINPRHVGAHVLLAEHLIDAEQREAAAAHLEEALAVNSLAPEAHALRAVLALLERNPIGAEQHRERALSSWRNNPRVDHLIGQKLSQTYQFSEGAEAQRRALRLDPRFTPAKLQLAQDLLRLGQEDEGWRLAAEAQGEDGYNVEAYNLTTLQDKLHQFTTLESAHFRVRMGASEAPIYGDRVLALLERARERLVAQYGVTLPEQTIVEIYPDPKDFAVRTFGMPDIGGFLGVCFGPVFTINSPASARSNWEAVLWHEFVHVVTLTATRNRMPRWLSEGISVYEEQQADPRWGQRMTLDYRERILAGRMQPISRMSAAFLEAKDGSDTQFAYFQSGLVVQFLVEQHGFERLQALLRSLGSGREPNSALVQHYGDLRVLDGAFADYARAQASAFAAEFDLSKPERGSISQLLANALPFGKRKPVLHARLQEIDGAIESGDWATARTALEELTQGGTYLPGTYNLHARLARVCAELKDREGERSAWTTVAQHEADALDAATRLLALAQEDEHWEEVVRWSQAWLAIHPLAPSPWRALLDAHERLGDRAAAAHAGTTLLHLDPPDFVSLHYRVARALLSEDPERARQHVLNALEEAPRFRAAYDLLAEIPPSPAPAPL